MNFFNDFGDCHAPLIRSVHNFGYGLRVIIENLHHDVRCKPCAIGQLRCELGYIERRGFCPLRNGRVSFIAIIFKSSEGYSRSNALATKFISVHGSVLDGLVIFQTHNTSAHCLGQLIHCTTSSLSILSRKSRPVSNTLHRRNGLGQIFTGGCEFSNICDHIGEIVASLIGKCIKTIKFSIDILEGVPLSLKSCNRRRLRAKLFKAGRNLVNGKRFNEMFSCGHSFIHNVLKSRDCYNFHCREFLLNGNYATSESVKTDIVCGTTNVLKSFRTIFQLKAVFQVSNTLKARLDSTFELFVIKLHLYDALVNG